MRRRRRAAALAALIFSCPVTFAVGSSRCRSLLSLTDFDVSMLTAEVVQAADGLPAHCRVVGRIDPAVHFEVRLPEGWNGKFYMVGNGGYLGAFFDQSYGLARGYATASTDTGHQGPSPAFAHNNRAAEIDFGFRAMHVSVVAAKRVVEAHYGRPPRYSYYRGCSTGGRQGMMEAQRFPDDFDGWSIGAPIYDYTYKQTYNAAWVAQALFGNDGAGYVPRPKLKALGRAVYARCDGLDGLEDGLIEDPRRCDFVPARDLRHCPAGTDARDCFSASQIEAITRIYDGPGEDLYPGAVKGGEWIDVPAGTFGGGWDVYFTGLMRTSPRAGSTVGQMGRDAYGGDEFQPVQLRNATSFFKYLAFEEDRPDFDVLEDLDFAQVPDTSFMASIMNAMETELSAIHDSGKKIVMWHGWADVGLNPIRSIRYLERVRQAMGEGRTDEFLRLFMVPGMYHCSGGPGPDVFDDLSALEDWVEQGSAPSRMIAYKTAGANDFAPHRGPRGESASRATIVRSRPLCPYPQVARYQGGGSIDSHGNFRCLDP